MELNAPYRQYSLLRTTLLFCAVVKSVLCITVCIERCRTMYSEYFLLACNQPNITGMQPTQPYRHGTCCFASVTMPHTLYTYLLEVVADCSVDSQKTLRRQKTLLHDQRQTMNTGWRRWAAATTGGKIGGECVAQYIHSITPTHSLLSRTIKATMADNYL